MRTHNPATCPEAYAANGQLICPHTNPNPTVVI